MGIRVHGPGFQARMYVNGKRVSLGVFKSYEEAELALADARAARTSEKTPLTPAEQLALKQADYAAKKDNNSKVLDVALGNISKLQQQLDTVLNLQNRTPQVFDIQPKVSKGTSESVAFIVASDWHSEEEVKLGQVGGLNEHTLEVGEARAERFWQGGLRLFDIFRRDTIIKTIVLALLGDFITNSIHDDLIEGNLLAPTDAIYRVQNMLISGIHFLIQNTPKDTEILVVCHGGNHGRITPDQRIASETGNSLEQYMYYTIRDFFKNEPRVKFQIAEGYHTYVTLFNERFITRFHHGHGISYQGGVGGLTIPTNKKIAQWNQGRKADLDVFGHFHTFFDSNNFISNGSLIGYNAYAVRIGAAYEPPKQAFFLVNQKYMSKTIVTPIFV